MWKSSWLPVVAVVDPIWAVAAVPVVCSITEVNRRARGSDIPSVVPPRSRWVAAVTAHRPARVKCAARMEVIQSLAASPRSVAVAVPRYITARALPQASVVRVAVLLAVTLVTAGHSVRARQAKAIPVLLQVARGIPVAAAALVGLALITQREVVWVSNTPSRVHPSTLQVAAAVLGIPVMVEMVVPVVAVAAQWA